MTRPSAVPPALGVEPNALPHEVLCACCPRRVTLLTKTYPAPDTPLEPNSGATVEYWEPARPARFPPPNDSQVFMRGLLFTVKESGHGHAHLVKCELPSETTPHHRNAYRLPSFALEVEKVIWVCPTCEEIFKGHAFNVEQYLAEQWWILDNFGLRFKLSNSF